MTQTTTPIGCRLEPAAHAHFGERDPSRIPTHPVRWTGQGHVLLTLNGASSRLGVFGIERAWSRGMDLSVTFDRGTLLLETSSSPFGAGSMKDDDVIVRRSLLPLLRQPDLGLVWDARVAAFRAPANRYAELLRATRELDFNLNNGCPTPARIAFAAPSLRDYQAAALDAWRISQRGIIVLPTGAGKTRVAIAAIASLGLATVILVPTRALLWQWHGELSRWYPDAIGIYGDGEHKLAPITIATFASAYRHLDRFGQQFGLLVADEAHHFASGIQAEALEMCTAAARLGLTATLDVREGDSNSMLGRLLGPVVFRQAVADLSGQHLAPFDHIRLFVRLNREEQSRYDSARQDFRQAYSLFRRGGGSSRWQAFVAACYDSDAGKKALRGYYRSQRIVARAAQKRQMLAGLLSRHRSEAMLVFTADNDAAYAIATELLLPAITCDIGRKERDALFAALREGEIGTLVSSRVLNEGIDLPEVRLGAILGGSHGDREHVQRVGRLLRPREGKRAIAYEIVCDNTYEVVHAEKRQRALF